MNQHIGDAVDNMKMKYSLITAKIIMHLAAFSLQTICNQIAFFFLLNYWHTF